MALRRDVPSSSLQQELEETAKVARRFVEIIQGSNLAAEGFPREELVAIAESLARLPLGTAEGCRLPLEYARSRLPALRREYFVPEVATSLEEKDLWPTPGRGLHLDQGLTELIGAVATALDEYRRLAREAVDDSDEADVVLAAPNSKAAAMSKLSELSQSKLREGYSNVSEMLGATSKIKGRLQAQLADAETIAQLADTELKLKPVFVRWVKAMGAELRKAPRRLQQLGRAIQVGADVAQPLAHRWSSFWSNFESFLFGEFRELGKSIEEIGNTLERGRRSAKSSAETTEAAGARSDSDFSRWLTTFVSERQTSGAGIPIAEVALGIQFNFRQRPRDFAKSIGFRTVTDLVNHTDGVFVYTNGFVQRVVLSSNRDGIFEDVEREMRDFSAKFQDFARDHPTCDTKQFDAWLTASFPTGVNLPSEFTSPSKILSALGYEKLGKRRWGSAAAIQLRRQQELFEKEREPDTDI